MAQSLWLLAVVFLSGHPAAQLECPPDKEIPLWNHIHLHKSGDFICHGIPVHSSSWPVTECPPVVWLTTVDSIWNHIHLCKRDNFISCGILLKTFSCPVGVSSSQRLTTVDSVWNPIHLRKRDNFISCGILLRTFSRPVGVSSSQRLTTVYSMWNHIHLCKRGNFISCGILLRTFSSPVGASSSQRLTTVDWNHIHLLKSGNFICHRISVRLSSCPAGVSSRQRGIVCWTTSTWAKAAILFAMVFLSIHLCSCQGYRVSSFQRPTIMGSVWNHIHLRKRGNFICCGILLRTFSRPVGVSFSRRLTHCGITSICVKGAILLVLLFSSGHPAPAAQLEFQYCSSYMWTVPASLPVLNMMSLIPLHQERGSVIYTYIPLCGLSLHPCLSSIWCQWV